MVASVAASPVQIRCKGILFDMDGILISSIGTVERTWTKWAKRNGVDPELACKTAHGCRAIETVVRLRPDLDAEAELKILEEMEVNDNDGVAMLPGVLKLIDSLPRDRWTVVTSATTRIAKARLAAGGVPLPERLITAEDVHVGKPDPRPYLAGAELLGFPPQECVVFEDSAAGVQAGRAAGCIVVATPFSHPVESLSAAHYLVPDLTGVEVKPGGDERLIIEFKPMEGSQVSGSSPGAPTVATEG